MEILPTEQGDMLSSVDNPPALPINPTIEQLIAHAIDQQVPVETLERLLAVMERVDMKRAQQAYYESMSAFQSACPIIKKTKVVTLESGRVAYRYAPLDVIISQVKGLLKQYGFSYSIDTKPGQQRLHVICTVRHSAGHCEFVCVEMAYMTKTALMSDAQVEAATMTIATRRAFCNAFGILTGDSDTDGNVIEGKQTTANSQPTIESATSGQLQELAALAGQTGIPMQNICAKYMVQVPSQLTCEQAEAVITALQAYRARRERERKGVTDDI